MPPVIRKSLSRLTLAIGLPLVIGMIHPTAVSSGADPEPTRMAVFDYVSVPEVRHAPDSRSIEVAYLHLAGKAKGVPTFVFFGGPGESALDYPSTEALRAAHESLLAHGDVVFVEQRGVGASRPSLDCEPLAFPLDQPLTADGVIAAYERLLPPCIEAAGADLRGYTTGDIADDAEVIRRTLGFDRINVAGGSYGAQQAYYYLRRYGAHVNRAVLTQFLAPDASLALPSTIDHYIREIGDRVGPEYGLGDRGGEMLADLMRSVFDRVAAQPVDIRVGETLITAGRTDLEIVTSLALRRTRESWMLPHLFKQMSDGEFGFIGGVMLQFFRGGLPVNAAVLAFDCAAQVAPGQREQFASEVGESLTGRGAHLPFPDVCDAFEHGLAADADLNPGDLHGVPTLIIQGELDPRARDESMAAVVAGQDDVRVLVIRNATHDLGRSASEEIGERLDEIEARFLGDGEWPESGEIEVPLSLN